MKEKSKALLLFISFFSFGFSQLIYTIGGKGNGSFSGDNEISTSASMYYPTCVHFSSGLYIGDTLNSRIRFVNELDQKISTVAGNGVTGFSGDGGPPLEATINNPSSVVVMGGNLFFAEDTNHRVRVVTENKISTYAGNGSCEGVSGDGGPPSKSILCGPNALAADLQRNILYIIEAFNGRVRAVNSSEIISTILRDYAYCFGMAVDPRTGNLYIAANPANAIHKYDIITQTVTVVAGNGTAGFSGDGGPATRAQLQNPWDVYIDLQGMMWIADRLNHRVRLVNLETNIITTFAGNGKGAYAGDNQLATNASLNEPHSVTGDSHGNIYIADTKNFRIRKVDSSGIITTFVGIPGMQILRPVAAIRHVGDGEVYFTDAESNQVKIISSSQQIKVVAGTGDSDYYGDTGPALQAAFDYPSFLAVNVTDYSLYVTDTYNNKIRRIFSNGIIDTVVGNGTNGTADGIPAINASLNSPYGLAFDQDGNLWIGAGYQYRIRKVDKYGIITSLMLLGTQPFGIALDGLGNIILAAGITNQIIKQNIANSSIVSIIVENFSDIPNNGDGGLASAANVIQPFGIAVDPFGNIIISDKSSNKIRVINANTNIITSIAGNGTSLLYGDGGPAIKSCLSGPQAIFLDGSDLYIAEEGNGRIRKIVYTPCQSSDECQSRACWGDSLCTNSRCEFQYYNSTGKSCDDGVFCNGQDFCDEFAMCSLHSTEVMNGKECPCSSQSILWYCDCNNGVCGTAGANVKVILSIFVPIGSVVAIAAIIFAVVVTRKYFQYRLQNQAKEMFEYDLAATNISGVTVLETIGEGNFGRVFHGSWRGIPVALKELKEMDQFADFVREASLLQSLRHPHVVSFFGIFSNAEQCYLVFEFMDRGSLNDFLYLWKNSLSDTDLHDILVQAARGMQYLEEHNILHRDLAARNLLVNSQSQKTSFTVKVADFGLGTLLAPDQIYNVKSKRSIPVRWSAPEVLSHRKFSHKSDVWSFGILIWEVFSKGIVPYPGFSNYETTQKVVSGYRMQPPPNCPESWVELMFKCWDEKPGNRPSFSSILKWIEPNPSSSSSVTTLKTSNNPKMKIVYVD